MRPQRPGTYMPSLTIWGLTAWWLQLILNPLQSSQSLIKLRIEMFMPEWLVVIVLAVLVAYGIVTGLISRDPLLRLGYYFLSFLWWAMVVIFTIASGVWSTGTGSYGLVVVLSLWLFFTTLRSRPTREQVGQVQDRPREGQRLPVTR